MSTKSPPLALVAVCRVAYGLYSSILGLLTNGAVFVWDFGLFISNLVRPNLPAQSVVPQGCAGARGIWPQFVPPQEGDSRCSCPALNAMANHGILPHNGRGISFQQLGARVRETYNFAPTFCFFVPKFAADMLSRDYRTGTFNLSDLDVHNCIEHDGSLVREDSIVCPDQGKLAVPRIEELLSSGTGPNGDLTPADLSRLSSKRRAESKKNNPQFSLTNFQRFFGSSNSSTLLTIFGGKVKDLRTFLLEERIPDGWQSSIRHPHGLTMAEFNATAIKVELGITEELPESFGFASEDATEKKKL